MSADDHEAADQFLKEAVTLVMFQDTFEDWRIFCRNGRYWAMRAGTVTVNGAQSLILPVVWANTLEELGDALSLQEWLRRMTAEELDLVWRYGLDALMARHEDPPPWHPDWMAES